MERNNVVAPNHYTQGHVEVIYEIYDILGPVGFKAFCLGNWIKYNSRAAHKGGEEDLKKAEVYLEWATKGLPNLEQRQKEIAASRIPSGASPSPTLTQNKANRAWIVGDWAKTLYGGKWRVGTIKSIDEMGVGTAELFAPEFAYAIVVYLDSLRTSTVEEIRAAQGERK